MVAELVVLVSSAVRRGVGKRTRRATKKKREKKEGATAGAGASHRRGEGHTNRCGTHYPTDNAARTQAAAAKQHIYGIMYLKKKSFFFLSHHTKTHKHGQAGNTHSRNRRVQWAEGAKAPS
ncbi:hypothetical protein TRSC58_07691 [Trypanosoma rangeli SC58]|uniref:Uncharacterized protein n=1 Tax=Trypanosoma rangeli SC58 TaxID=429131 RepID=A0A061IRI1_TRYRA|nr:hypothetical protein TRSC58_07691 [Trypanosoma rangeli SC58]